MAPSPSTPIVPVTEQQAQMIFDAIITEVESLEPSPMARLATEAFRQAADRVGLPALWDALRAKGYVQ